MRSKVHNIAALDTGTLLVAITLTVAQLACSFDVSIARAQERGEGRASLVMTYQCKADKRAAFRAHMESTGVAQFERWKKAGIYQDYLILFSSYVNSGNGAQDMVVRLDFAKYADTANWKAIERTMPAGLTREALTLCTPVASYLADLLYEGEPSAKRDLSKAVYLWIPYHLEKGVGKAAYREYFEVYVKPQADGWLADGVLSWWGVYFNQHSSGPPWDVVFLYEYSDIVGLARRDNVKEAVRAKLKSDPAWKKMSDAKQSYRWEDQAIIMDPILFALKPAKSDRR